MAEGYYYIISGLPELSLNDKSSDWNMLSYRQMIRPMLQPEDAQLLDILYYKYYIQNAVALMLDAADGFNAAGNFTKKQLEEGLAQPDLLPEFLKTFVESNIRSREKKSEKTLLNEATTAFVDWCKTIENPLLKRWMHFENNLKNLLIWLNSHKFDLDPTKEVVGNHFEADYLRQTEKDQIDIKAWEYHFREVLTHYDNPNIAVREFIIDEMRWHYLNELEEKYIFSVERLLCFAIRLQIINRNIAATEEDGTIKRDQLLSEIRAAYVMPEDF